MRMLRTPIIHLLTVFPLSAALLTSATASAKDFNSQFGDYQKNTDRTQTDRTLRSKYDADGIVLTYEAYADVMTDKQDAEVGIPDLGKPTQDYQTFSPKIIAGLPTIDQDRRSAFAVKGETDGEINRNFFASDTQPKLADGHIFGLSTYLGSFTDISKPIPVVHIVVSPNPPTDYTVSINGRVYQATSKSLYVVSGTISIVVIRTGKQPCLWAGTPVAEKVQDVACSL